MTPRSSIPQQLITPRKLPFPARSEDPQDRSSSPLWFVLLALLVLVPRSIVPASLAFDCQLLVVFIIAWQPGKYGKLGLLLLLAHGVVLATSRRDPPVLPAPDQGIDPQLVSTIAERCRDTIKDTDWKRGPRIPSDDLAELHVGVNPPRPAQPQQRDPLEEVVQEQLVSCQAKDGEVERAFVALLRKHDSFVQALTARRAVADSRDVIAPIVQRTWGEVQTGLDYLIHAASVATESGLNRDDISNRLQQLRGPDLEPDLASLNNTLLWLVDDHMTALDRASNFADISKHAKIYRVHPYESYLTPAVFQWSDQFNSSHCWDFEGSSGHLRVLFGWRAFALSRVSIRPVVGSVLKQPRSPKHITVRILLDKDWVTVADQQLPQLDKESDRHIIPLAPIAQQHRVFAVDILVHDNHGAPYTLVCEILFE